jgi:eukaryotic-like serine/threonine-protein kinase
VLFEMLTGTRAFPGDDITDILAAVVRAEPEWKRLPADTPPAIRQVLRRCLEKDAKERLPSVGSARLEIKDVLASSSASVVATPMAPVVRTGRAKTLAWLAAAVVVIGAACAATAAWWLRDKPIEAITYRASLLPPEKNPWAGNPATRFAVSPDGRRLAFLATGSDGTTRIWIRPLDGLVAQPLNGTEGAVLMFWSHDNQRLAFNAGGKMRVVSVSGGPPITIANAASNNGGTWSRADVILFEPTGTNVFRINAAGGTPVAVTELDKGDADVSHWQPFFLPDGRHFLFHLTASKTHPGGAVVVGSLDGREKPKLLLEGGSNAQYALGYLLFMRDTTLMAQRFDPVRLELSGDAVPVTEQLQVGGSTGRTAAFSVSQNGALVYQTGAGGPGTRLTWYDRAGKEQGTLGDPADYGDVEMSHDGSRVAVSVFDPSGRTRDLWLVDVKRGLRTRFTFEPGDDISPIWSPDDSRVVYSARQSGGTGGGEIFQRNLFQKLANGSGASEPLFTDSNSKGATSWSPDGRSILFTSTGLGSLSTDIWMLPLVGDRKPTPFLQTKFTEVAARFSPDGRWVAYQSNESGRTEVYVVPVAGQGKWQVSSSGGNQPRWRRDGKEIFFVNSGKLMAVEVNATPARFETGPVRLVLDVVMRTDQRFPYDVAPDGQHFVVNAVVQESLVEPATLVVNWTAALPR